jgi:hypothetical protein
MHGMADDGDAHLSNNAVGSCSATGTDVFSAVASCPSRGSGVANTRNSRSSRSSSSSAAAAACGVAGSVVCWVADGATAEDSATEEEEGEEEEEEAVAGVIVMDREVVVIVLAILVWGAAAAMVTWLASTAAGEGEGMGDIDATLRLLTRRLVVGGAATPSVGARGTVRDGMLVGSATAVDGMKVGKDTGDDGAMLDAAWKGGNAGAEDDDALTTARVGSDDNGAWGGWGGWGARDGGEGAVGA